MYDDYDDGPEYPVGEMIDCYSCTPVTGTPRRCTALGPVTAVRYDATQTYQLECGHLAI